MLTTKLKEPEGVTFVLEPEPSLTDPHHPRRFHITEATMKLIPQGPALGTEPTTLFQLRRGVLITGLTTKLLQLVVGPVTF